MTIYLSNRDGNGKTSEEGHYRLPTGILDGNVLDLNDLKVTENSPVGMTVLVTAGDYRIPSGTGYSYTGWNSASAPLAIPTSDPANPRISTIILYVDKGASTSPSPVNNPGIAKLMVVTGSAAASPTAPNDTAVQSAVGSGNPFIRLANITVPTSASTVVNANIADVRERIRLTDDVINASNLSQNTNDKAYPVGSIYINATNNANPAVLLGIGTWVAFGAGRIPVGFNSGDTDFNASEKTGGAKTHRHKGYADGDGLGNGDLRATIGAASGDAGSINYQAISPENPNTGAGLGNGTYSVNGSGGSNRGFSHYTKVVGYTSTSSSLQPYITVYMWKRTA